MLPSLACNNISNIHDSLCLVIKMASLRLTYDTFSNESCVLYLMVYLSTSLTYISVMYIVINRVFIVVLYVSGSLAILV